jgi:hypothetical protein
MILAFIKRINPLFWFTAVALIIPVSFFLLAFHAKKENLKYDTQKTIGILRDAYVIPTAFNEFQKTQIKTDKKFIVVKGFPQLTFGDSVEVRMRNNLIIQMKDNSGEWFETVKQKP